VIPIREKRKRGGESRDARYFSGRRRKKKKEVARPYQYISEEKKQTLDGTKKTTKSLTHVIVGEKGKINARCSCGKKSEDTHSSRENSNNFSLPHHRGGEKGVDRRTIAPPTKKRDKLLGEVFLAARSFFPSIRGGRGGRGGGRTGSACFSSQAKKTRGSG